MNGYALNPCRCAKPDDRHEGHIPALKTFGFQNWQVVCECGAAGPKRSFSSGAVDDWNENNKPKEPRNER